VFAPWVRGPLPKPSAGATRSKKVKKPPKYSLRHISLGIPTNIAAGPLGFLAELGIGPKGERSYSHRDVEIRRPNPTATRDLETGTDLQVSVLDLCHDRARCSSMCFSPSEEKVGGTREEECQPGVTSGGAHHCRCVVRFPLTHPSSGENLGGHGAWGFLAPCHRDFQDSHSSYP